MFRMQLPKLREGCCRLYLCRHGETDLNLKGFIQGRGVDAPLNTTGERQAKMLGEHIEPLPLQALYCSSLKRSKQTAAIIQKHHQHLTIHQTPDLDEMSFGLLEGQPHTGQSKLKLNQLFSSWDKGNYTEGFESGENPLQVLSRGRQAIESMLQYDHVLAVAHGRLLKILISSLVHSNLSEMHGIEQDNCCLNVIDYDRESKRFKVVQLNDTSFLNCVSA